MAKTSSPALAMLHLVWNDGCKATPHSWDRVNQSMYRALMLAIDAGLRFDVGDIAVAKQSTRSGRWIGYTGWEPAYALAVALGNVSFIECFEAHFAREPFRGDNVVMDSPRSTLHVGTIRRQRERLAVGSTFDYAGYRAEVTSFAGDSLTACTYKQANEGEYRKKIDKRFTITHDDLKRDRAERKERAKIWQEAVGWNERGRLAFYEALGMPPKRVDYDRLPIVKIRKAYEKTKHAA